MLSNVLFNSTGALLFLFLFWKRLKEDHISNQIFSSAAFLLFAVFIAKIISNAFLPNWWFWITFGAVSVAFALGIIRYRLRIFETLEATVVSFLPWLSFFFLSDSIANSSISSLIASLAIFLLVIIFFLLDKHYKKFSWYKSGRVGFTGLTILGLFFIIRGSVALAFPDMLSFSGKHDVYLSAIVAFASFLVVFNLSRS